MRPPGPFPPELSRRVFTLAQARRAGVTPARLRSSDILRIDTGLYAQGLEQPSEAALLAGFTARHRETWGSHVTAARLHRLPLPRRLEGDARLHLSRARRMPPLSVNAAVVHRILLRPGETMELEPPDDGPPGFAPPVSTRERTWIDLAQLLPLGDLVALGDHLVRIPRARFESRSEPWSTPGALARMAADHTAYPGIVRAREALELVRVGADSPAETKLRLALVKDGLPEPELQVSADPSDPFAPVADLGYRRWRLALQYDGDHHRTREQLASDNRRDLRFAQAGWRVMKFDWQDYRGGFARAVRLVGEAIATAGRAA
ncbi:endonuclease domain-containing protein [Zafaria sp. J156]|uniref:endonuclease domain-containing protein n=1 Tax=Zafaria sp. J156 TaxID=3116490 RepID=UPI002E770108|nr:hypothetical protein [Zafaria sp. J156]MEE1620934.1 hypothetical protein [Zafaria sp. J156]